MPETSEGWGFPEGGATKCHFFAASVSLCRRWRYRGRLEPDDGQWRSFDCKSCRKALAKREEAIETAKARGPHEHDLAYHADEVRP